MIATMLAKKKQTSDPYMMRRSKRDTIMTMTSPDTTVNVVLVSITLVIMILPILLVLMMVMLVMTVTMMLMILRMWGLPSFLRYGVLELSSAALNWIPPDLAAPLPNLPRGSEMSATPATCN